MPVLILSVLIGIVAGMRAMTAPAAVSWGARLGWLRLEDTWLAFLAAPATPWVLTVLALGELVTDQLPSTPSRTVPIQFGTRIVTGAVAGGALAAPAGQLMPGLAAGVVGAVIGTLGGRAARGALANAFGGDRPAAFLEDGAALILAYLVLRAAA